MHTTLNLEPRRFAIPGDISFQFQPECVWYILAPPPPPYGLEGVHYIRLICNQNTPADVYVGGATVQPMATEW